MSKCMIYFSTVLEMVLRSFTQRPADSLPKPEVDPETGNEIERSSIGVLPGPQQVFVSKDVPVRPKIIKVGPWRWKLLRL